MTRRSPTMWGALAGSLVFLLGLTSSPAESPLAIPKPTAPLLPPPPPPAIEPSVVNLAVSASLQHVAQAVQASFPIHHQHEDEWMPGKRLLAGAPFEYRYYLWRGPAQFKLTGSQLLTEFPDVRYRIAARLAQADGPARTGTCGYGDEWPRHLRLTATSLLTWTESWRLHTTTTFGPPTLADDCRLAPVMADVGPLLTAGLNERLPQLAAAIDRTVAEQAEAKQRAEVIWQRLHEPVELKRGMWLAYRRSGALAGPIATEGEATVRSVVSLVFNPIITLGTKPALPPTSLPPLQLGRPAAAEGMHLGIPIYMSYEELNRRLLPQVVGEEIRWHNQLSVPIHLGLLGVAPIVAAGCDKGFKTWYGTIKDMVAIPAGDFVSVCFLRARTVRYNVWTDISDPFHSMSPTAIIHLDEPA